MIPIARPMIGDDERAAVLRVLDSGNLAAGVEVAAFEDEFSATVAGRPCVAVNSGTAALHLGLLAAGVGAGDEVIVPSFTFAATANAVALTGATPVFADVDIDTYCLDPAAVEAAVTPRTVAVVPVHLYGHPAKGVAAVAARHNLLMLEDAAQAHGAWWDGRPVGALGDMAAFSFYPTKNMTTGEGGMVVCSDEQTARRVRLLRNQGMERRYENEVVGFNARMSDLHAAIGRAQFAWLPLWNQTRRFNADFYTEGLRGVVTPFVSPLARHVFHQYTIRVPGRDRDEFVAGLARRGVAAGVYYPTPVHRLPAYRYRHRADLPNTDELARSVLSLPVHPSLTVDELNHVVEAVNATALGA